MKRIIVGAALLLPTATLLGAYLLHQLALTLGIAVENLGDIEWGEDWAS